MPRLSADQLSLELASLPGWVARDGSLARTLQRPSFLDAVALVGKVAQSAEAMNHHPDIRLFGYNKLEFLLFTHDEGGVTERDLALAAEISTLAEQED